MAFKNVKDEALQWSSLEFFIGEGVFGFVLFSQLYLGKRMMTGVISVCGYGLIWNLTPYAFSPHTEHSLSPLLQTVIHRGDVCEFLVQLSISQFRHSLVPGLISFSCFKFLVITGMTGMF
jgi:hypothetical protein